MNISMVEIFHTSNFVDTLRNIVATCYIATLSECYRYEATRRLEPIHAISSRIYSLSQLTRNHGNERQAVRLYCPESLDNIVVYGAE